MRMTFLANINRAIPSSIPVNALASLCVVPRRVSIADFDQCIADFDGAVLEMTASFSANRWPSVQLEAWIYNQGHNAVAAAIIMVQHLPMQIASIAIVKWGPILANDADPMNKFYYQEAVTHLMQEYAQQRRMMLSVMPRAELLPRLDCLPLLLKMGFKVGDALSFPNRYVVNLRLTDVEQRKSFSQKWRYHLNKSEKNDLVFEIAERSDFPRFDRLYQAMAERKKFPDYSAYNTLEALFASEATVVQPQLFFITKAGKDIAGAVIYKSGKTAVYLYGATNDEALPLRAGYFMHAKIISWLRDNTKADWYDLGGTDGFAGLHQFKKGMLGSAGIISPMPPIANYAQYYRPYLVGHTAYAGRRVFQKLRKHWVGLISPKAKPDQNIAA